jgi:hypothetical protein
MSKLQIIVPLSTRRRVFLGVTRQHCTSQNAAISKTIESSIAMIDSECIVVAWFSSVDSETVVEVAADVIVAKFRADASVRGHLVVGNWKQYWRCQGKAKQLRQKTYGIQLCTDQKRLSSSKAMPFPLSCTSQLRQLRRCCRPNPSLEHSLYKVSSDWRPPSLI